MISGIRRHLSSELETFLPIYTKTGDVYPKCILIYPRLSLAGDVYPRFILIYPHLSLVGDVYSRFILDSQVQPAHA